MEISRLIEIAKTAEQADLVSKLQELDSRMNLDNAPLVLPLVGEFSSGKTSLINALTDSKKLETATLPTTATIFEVHFGGDSCKATVVRENGDVEEVSDISELKNEHLKDASLVEVFDTSDRVPSSTILVDTPGISSPDLKHKEVLTAFLPNADAVLVVVDVRTLLTKSLEEFIRDGEVSNRPFYVVITKTDTVTENELSEVKKQIASSSLGIKKIVCASAEKNELDEVYDLLKEIDSNKISILKSSCEKRAAKIAKELALRIDEIIASSEDDGKIDELIAAKKSELEKIKGKISKILNSTAIGAKEIEKQIVSDFENEVTVKLDNLLLAGSRDYDSEANSIIGSVTSKHLSEYKSKIHELFLKQSNEYSDDIALSSLSNIDVEPLQLALSEYNISLNTVGHCNDAFIAKTVTTALKIGGGGLVLATIWPYLLVGGGISLFVLLKLGIADSVVVEVVNLIKQKKTKQAMEILKKENERLQAKCGEVREVATTTVKNTLPVAAALNYGSRFVENVVSKVTDKISKPERQRLLHHYIDDTLIPEFREQMKGLSEIVISMLEESLSNEASEMTAQETKALADLKVQKAENAQSFEERMKLLTEYKVELSA